MSMRLPQRMGQPEHFAPPPDRAHPQYEQSVLQPEQIGCTALGLCMKSGHELQSHPGAGADGRRAELTPAPTRA